MSKWKNFITFEGGEGAGKSTQIKIISNLLQKDGYDVLTTREPGGSPLAELIRNFLLDPNRPKLLTEHEALLFAAARSDHLHNKIIPHLNKGGVVLCDRFNDSTKAYQGQLLSPEQLHLLDQYSVGDNSPSTTFIFDIDPLIGTHRTNIRRGNAQADRFEAEDFSFHLELRERFLEILRKNPSRCILVDATKDIEEISLFIYKEITQRIK